MVHQMNLLGESFEKIKCKSKTIEMRLNDNKRSHIKIGDTIEFRNLSNGQTINCIVNNLFHYKDFKELYQQHGKVLLGYEDHEVANPSDMLDFYTRKDIDTFGVLGIEIRVL